MRPHPRLQTGDSILLHAASRGVGLIVAQWAGLLGLTVIGTVSSDAKGELAGLTAATTSSTTAARMWPPGWRALTGGAGVDVVFDSVRQEHLHGLA